MYKATVLYTRQGRGLYTTHGKHEARHEAKVCRYMRQNMMLEVRQRCGKAVARSGRLGDTPERAPRLRESRRTFPRLRRANRSSENLGKGRKGSDKFGVSRT